LSRKIDPVLLTRLTKWDFYIRILSKILPKLLPKVTESSNLLKAAEKDDNTNVVAH